MVSLWPWKSEDNSPASFEKALATLSTKITKSQQSVDKLKQLSRRRKALWTLYTSFTYVLCTVILAFVVGWETWSTIEYGAIAATPVIIYVVRKGIVAFYQYRIDTVSQRLEEQQAERAKTIDKLKAATKYNSTQQLLEKYGGVPPASSKPKAKSPARVSQNDQKQVKRTSMPPPPTANIPRGEQAYRPATPQSNRHSIHEMPRPQSRPTTPMSIPEVGPPEFAANAFPSGVPQYVHSHITASGGRWYDRVLDVLLGEDETLPKNRFALICKHCRLVNGQAPPGTKRMEELGHWRCMSCGGTNGVVDEEKKLVEHIQALAKDDPLEVASEKSVEDFRGHDKDSVSGEHDYELMTGSTSVDEATREMNARKRNRTGQNNKEHTEE